MINQACLKINFPFMHPVGNGQFYMIYKKKNCALKDNFFDLKKYGNINYSHNLTLMLHYFCAGCKKALLQCFIASESNEIIADDCAFIEKNGKKV